ncbi:MAG: hypothetical protein XU09_C0009G0039 [Thaumarchaeota archaeon CSP1-1]|nr:MAG: hypothetical protein XU09_C0009G0039 [Thaumarchaeota archaeon CSP1-1]
MVLNQCNVFSKKGIFIIFPIIIALILVSSSAVPSYAVHQSDKLTWQLVMISSYPACSNYHYQMTERYNEITQSYFGLYQLENTNFKPICMTEKKYNTEFEPSADLDLLIVVYDRNKGRAELHSNDIGGFYSHIGREWTHNHTIVFCDCPNFKFSDPNWILTHELSHFILYYLGFDSKVVEDHVHDLDAKYDYCVEEEYDEAKCLPVKTRMDTDSHRWTVMAPYADAIGKKVFSNEIDKDIVIPQYKIAMQAEITQWWLDGRITDEHFAKSLEILTEDEIDLGSTVEFISKDSRNVIFTDPPKDLKDDLLESDTTIEWVKQREKNILLMVPFAENIEEEIPNDELPKSLPQWFKTRAIWWISGKITHEEFVSGMQYLFKN